MAAEIELKLCLPEAALDPLRQHPLLQRWQRHPPATEALDNRYFDTPEQALNRHAVALRVRRQGAAFIQTLKTRGSSQGGLHQRHEWEWALPTAELDASLLPSDALPAGIEPQQLETAFHTDFERTTWRLDYRSDDSAASIELVLDRGWVSAGARRDPIREIELELKGGDAEALIAFARELAASLPLRICRISKAERGYRLGAPERARRLPPLAQPDIDANQQQAFYQLAASLTERLQAAMEGFEFLHEAEGLLPLCEDLPALALLLHGYQAALPAEAQTLARQLTTQADALQQMLAPLLIERRWSGATPGQDGLATRLTEWLNSLALGQALLGLSALLYRRPWRQPAAPFRCDAGDG